MVNTMGKKRKVSFSSDLPLTVFTVAAQRKPEGSRLQRRTHNYNKSTVRMPWQRRFR